MMDMTRIPGIDDVALWKIDAMRGLEINGIPHEWRLYYRRFVLTVALHQIDAFCFAIYHASATLDNGMLLTLDGNFSSPVTVDRVDDFLASVVSNTKSMIDGVWEQQPTELREKQSEWEFRVRQTAPELLKMALAQAGQPVQQPPEDEPRPN